MIEGEACLVKATRIASQHRPCGRRKSKPESFAIIWDLSDLLSLGQTGRSWMVGEINTR